MPKLLRKTKRIVVRPYLPSDYEIWRTTWSTMMPRKNPWDAENKKPKDLTRAAFRKSLNFQRKMRKRDYFYDFGVFEKSTGALIGQVALMNLERGIAHCGYLGYRIFNRYWGKGFGKEAALTAIDIAFTDLKLHRIEAGVEPENRRSILMARSMGLRKEGMKKHAVFLRGKWVHLLNYSATCEEFGYKWRGQAKQFKR
jgi:ribosomal-protein-alanine N-acetyltransferase